MPHYGDYIQFISNKARAGEKDLLPALLIEYKDRYLSTENDESEYENKYTAITNALESMRSLMDFDSLDLIKNLAIIGKPLLGEDSILNEFNENLLTNEPSSSKNAKIRTLFRIMLSEALINGEYDLFASGSDLFHWMQRNQSANLYEDYSEIAHRAKETFFTKERGLNKEALLSFSSKMPLSSYLAKSFVSKDHESNRLIVDATHLDKEIFPIDDKSVPLSFQASVGLKISRMARENLNIYDLSEAFNLVAKLEMVDDSVNAALLADRIICNEKIKQSNFNVSNFYNISSGDSGNEFFKKNEDRILDIIESLANEDGEWSKHIDSFTAQELKYLGIYKKSGIYQASRDFAVFLGEIGTSRLGKLLYINSEDPISESNDLIVAAENFGQFSSDELLLIYKNSSKLNFSDFKSSARNNIVAFIMYAQKYEIDLPWFNKTKNPDGMQINNISHIRKIKELCDQVKQVGGDNRWLIEQTNNALMALPVDISEDDLEDVFNIIPADILKKTATYRRHKISNDFDL